MLEIYERRFGRMEDVIMNINYAKTILYAYKCLDSLMEQIDDLVEKKAFASISDLSPCELQCEKILALTAQKDVLIELKLKTEEILKEFSKEEYLHLEYKYFRSGDKKEFFGIDTTNRNYFRVQIRLAKKFASKLENCGVNDNWVSKNCLAIDFFKELLKRVVEKENAVQNFGVNKMNMKKQDNRLIKRSA